MTPKGLRAVMIACATIVSVMIILVVVYLGRKVLRRTRSLPLALASESNATIEPTSNDGPLGKRSCEPWSTNLATFDCATLRVTVYDVIRRATNNFNDVIGRGDFGIVYSATLPGGVRAAIKRLHGRFEFPCDRQFVAEMEAIAKVQHDNLIPLLGYYVCGDIRFLIYKHMRHGSLATLLRNQASNTPGGAIGWPDRLKICLGSARGLGFLHSSGSVTHIVHRNMKSSNILLDKNMVPKVSDFCLARVISAYETLVRTGASGTLGYVPPEYPLSMKGTAKGDVFGFGVVMLEVLTGRPPAGREVEEGGGSLVGWVRWMVAHGREGELFDPCLPATGLAWVQMVRVLAIALECTDDVPWKRPTMGSVVKELEMVQLLQELPHSLQGRVVY